MSTQQPHAQPNPAAPLTAEELLDQARQLAGGHAQLGATAYRAAALLGRSALEEAIWSLFPSLREASGRAMLVTLSELPMIAKPAVRQATLAWGRLSTMSHHHAYEMPPTTAELAVQLDAVQAMIEAIRQRQQSRAASTA